MAKGVEVHGKKLRVYFYHDQVLCREPLGLAATDENREYAERLVLQIEHEIKNGLFSYARWFPNSARLEQAKFNYWLDALLEIKRQRVAFSTYKNYANKIESHIRPTFGPLHVERVDRVAVEKWLANDLAALASKTMKDILALLREVFVLYRTRHPGALNPTDGIKVNLPDDNDPDPFTRAEIDLILSTVPRGRRPQEMALAKFMLWTGPRISEALALAWDDVIDLERGIIVFQRARVLRRYKATKTRRSKREIELLAPARQALQSQWGITGTLPAVKVDVMQRDNRTVKSEELKFVFLNSRTNHPHYSDWTIREEFWRHQLERAGVRYRPINQCRHTCISQMLTAGLPIEWISKQVGTSPTMIERRYGKWINQDATDIISIANKRLGLTGEYSPDVPKSRPE